MTTDSMCMREWQQAVCAGEKRRDSDSRKLVLERHARIYDGVVCKGEECVGTESSLCRRSILHKITYFDIIGNLSGKSIKVASAKLYF